MSSDIVNRAEFEASLQNYYATKSTSNRSVWNKVHEEIVITSLRESAEKKLKQNHHYHYSKLYELMTIDNKTRAILKRNDPSEPLTIMVAIKDYYEKLLEAHVHTGHGGRDKMMFYAKDKWQIFKTACKMFVAFCKTCVRKCAAPKKGIIVKPIILEGFNMRGQVDLIDFQSCPDGEFK